MTGRWVFGRAFAASGRESQDVAEILTLEGGLVLVVADGAGGISGGRDAAELEQELLLSHAPPLGTEPVDAWLQAHESQLGRAYVNDRRRHFGDQAAEPISEP